ncbi:MAG: glycosyltransferase [Sphingobacteriaceae bacterium]|nr:glycosyltransferase [Sphingobacteriaceae bacterium]
MLISELITEPWLQVASLIALIGFVLIIVNYILNYWSLAFFKSSHLATNSNLEPVSVIICAKNEDENLTEFLPKVLQQDYPNYEVIVVNDCSFDNTENVIDEFTQIFPNLKKVTIKEDGYYKHGKKFAVLVGIKAAQYENMVFMDADCYPSSDQWLKEMARGFNKEREVVLGYGAYEKQDTFLNKLIRFDTFMIAVQYLSSALKGKAYMGVGRNLGYKKDLFYRNKGFSSHYHINSGDDDLFVNQVANETNVNACIQQTAFTYSKAKTDFRGWKLQKARHLTTSPFYSASTKAKIGFNYFSQYLFWLSLLPLFFSINTAILAAGLLLLKVIFQWLVIRKAAIKLNEPDLWAMSFIYELFLLFIYPIFHLAKAFYKPNTWTN